MLPELAHLLLILALAAAAAQCWAGLGPLPQPRLARVALAWQAAGIAGAFALLGWAFVQDDFSVTYVVQHGHSQLPLLYKLSAIWGGHEGSLLLWLLLLALWSALAAWRLPGQTGASKKIAESVHHTCEDGIFDAPSPNAPLSAPPGPQAPAPGGAQYACRVLGMLGLVSLAMLAFVLLTSNPFMRLLPAAEQGQSLNPLLQDPGLALHPPLLYAGYVGTAVPFAMTLAVLAWGAPAGWVRAMRPFALWAWAFLSLGIALGSWWAYYELGWGGWWFWDPVENASFMPWLALAALVHTLAVREGRRSLPHWAAVLALGAFMLALLGLFLVRSGVITSVHAFASDPRRGVFLLGLMAAFLLGAMGLYASRAAHLVDAHAPPAHASGAWATRETALLLNNLLLTVACASVLLGTLYPLALDALHLGKISVGPPYFNTVAAPLFMALLALLLPAASLRWGQGPGPAQRRAWQRAGLALAALAALLALGLHWGTGRVSLPVLLALTLAAGLAAATLRWAAPRWRGMSAQQWGMCIAHLGVAVFAAGVAAVGGYGIERDVRLAPAATAEAGSASEHPIGGCTLRFERVQPARGANYTALAGHFSLHCPGQPPHPLVAEKRDYPGSSMPMTESAIRWSWLRDIYVALGEPLQATPYGAWSVRVQHKPLMRWVWCGVLLMALGALLAASGRRYRLRARQPDLSKPSGLPVQNPQEQGAAAQPPLHPVRPPAAAQAPASGGRP